MKTDTDTWWSDAEAAARRALAAQGVRDVSRQDDLVQETLVRLLAVRDRLNDEALVPYAVVTARNLAVSEHRRRRREDDAFAVLDDRKGRGADEETVRLEEASALHTALMRFTPTERNLLIDRDVHGVSITDLARRERSSVGAMRARLSRLRSNVRLEYTLALRGIDALPTHECRSVLRALAAGDAAKVRALSARSHVDDCATCAQLEPAVGQRKRWLAGIIAFFGLDRALAAVKAHPVASGVAGAGSITATAMTIAALSGSPAPPAATTPPPVVTSAPPTTAAPAATTPPPTTAAPAVAAPPQVLVDSEAWNGDFAGTPGRPVLAAALVVESVSGDETFVAQTAQGARVSVQLAGAGESPPAIRAGDEVTFDGLVSDVPDANEPPSALTVLVDYGAIQVVPAG